MACATTASTSPRSARRPGPACSPAATTTRSAWASSPTCRSAFPGLHRRASRGRRRRCRGCCATRATTRSPSASGTSCPRGERSRVGPVRPLAARLRLRALLRLPPGRHQPLGRRPRARQPLRRPAGRGPRTATTSPRTSPTTRSRYVHDQQHAAPDQPVLPLLRARRHARAAPRRARVGRAATAGAFDGGWEALARADIFARQIELGVVPAGTRAHRAAAVDRRTGTRCRADERRAVRASAGGVRRVPLAHRRADRPRARAPRGDRRARQHAGDAHVRQRRQRRGRPHRHVQRAPLHARRCPTTIDDNLARLDELGGFRSYNHYPWGWAWAGNTPLRLWKRYTWLGGTRTPLIVHWPDGIAGARRGARRSSCHAIDLMPTVLDACGIERPSTRRRRRAAAGRRREHPRHVRRRRRADRATSSTSRCSARARSSTTAGRPPPTTCRRAWSTRSELVGAAATSPTDHWALFRSRRRLRRGARRRRRASRGGRRPPGALMRRPLSCSSLPSTPILPDWEPNGLSEPALASSRSVHDRGGRSDEVRADRPAGRSRRRPSRMPGARSRLCSPPSRTRCGGGGTSRSRASASFRSPSARLGSVSTPAPASACTSLRRAILASPPVAA